MFKTLYLTFTFLFVSASLFASESQISNYTYDNITIQRHHYPSLTSTQDKIKEHLKGVSPQQWIMVTTDSQTSGKGMWGRSWVSPPGNVFVTYSVYMDSTQLKFLTCLSWISGVALTKTLESFGLTPKMRWINNALINGKKIGGILCGSESKGRESRAIIGIGINVNMTETQCARIDQPATSLSLQLGTDQDVGNVLSRLTSQIYACFYQLNDNKIRSLFENYRTSLAYVGEEVQIYDGQDTYQGLFQGLVGTEPDVRKAGHLILVDQSGKPVLKGINGQAQNNQGIFFTGEIVPRHS